MDIHDLDYQDDVLFDLFFDNLNEYGESIEGVGGSSSSEDDVVNHERDVDVGLITDADVEAMCASIFNNNDLYNPTLRLSIVFCTKEFQDMVQSYAIKSLRIIKFTKNDKRRMYGLCAQDGCQFKVDGLRIGNE